MAASRNVAGPSGGCVLSGRPVMTVLCATQARLARTGAPRVLGGFGPTPLPPVLFGIVPDLPNAANVARNGKV